MSKYTDEQKAEIIKQLKATEVSANDIALATGLNVRSVSRHLYGENLPNHASTAKYETFLFLAEEPEEVNIGYSTTAKGDVKVDVIGAAVAGVGLLGLMALVGFLVGRRSE